MNRRGQLMILGLMLCIIFFICAVVFIQPIKEQVTTARNPTNLDCNNASISTGQTGACIITDWFLPGFIGVVFAVALGLIGIKKWQDTQQ